MKNMSNVDSQDRKGQDRVWRTLKAEVAGPLTSFTGKKTKEELPKYEVKWIMVQWQVKHTHRRMGRWRRKPSRTLLGSWALKILCPPFLICRKQTAISWPSLSSKGQMWTVANQGREMTQIQGRAVKKQQCFLGTGPRSASTDTCNGIFKLFMH